jgi:hypothetical protein
MHCISCGEQLAGNCAVGIFLVIRYLASSIVII